ncbi:Nucleic-acid-binding protein [Aphis craccivora]|uniref:Nucleic-acid-binding protein n=1 Tax=Aphis craccivora TaxID=307492 RepID=A0A6G0YX83_APHCR|nr:Nucleic-acid-binding protein [Aphis craccivora]
MSIRNNPKKVTEKPFLRKTMSIKKMLDDLKFTFLRNLSKTQKFEILKIKNTTLSFPYCNDNDLSSYDFKCFISRRYLKILPFLLRNLNVGVFRPLKHKPPFSPTTGNYPRLTNHFCSESILLLSSYLYYLSSNFYSQIEPTEVDTITPNPEPDISNLEAHTSQVKSANLPVQ